MEVMCKRREGGRTRLLLGRCCRLDTVIRDAGRCMYYGGREYSF